MKDRLVDGVEVQRGSGNVFADLDLPDAGVPELFWHPDSGLVYLATAASGTTGKIHAVRHEPVSKCALT